MLFRNGNQTFNGLSPSPANTLGNSFDPEGLVILPQSGNLLVSDEYGPSVYEFTRAGQFLRAFQVPDNLVPKVGNTTNYTAAPVPGNVVAQYAYCLDGAGPAPAQGRGVSAIVALDGNRFMVLERNNHGVGVPDANLSSPGKKVYIIDISGASDVSAINLNTNTLPSGVNPVAKSGSSLVNLAAANILNDLL